MKRKPKFFFIVQGEGRGHLTQALALKELLNAAGYDSIKAMVGKSPEKSLPDFFVQGMDCSPGYFSSPNYVRDAQNRSIKVFASILATVFRAGQYLRSIRMIRKAIQKEQPDMIINFFEPLAGLACFCRPQLPVVCIGHQYLFLHPGFKFPTGYHLNKLAAKVVTRLTALGAKRLFALSFYPLDLSEKSRLVVMPPLLRQYILQLSENRGGHYLFYILNDGYSRDIISLHRKSKDMKSLCFWDKPQAPAVVRPLKNLTFYKLNGRRFLEGMAKAKAVMTTGGFETACEALFLKKPVLVVPVCRHYDQIINAHDLESNARLGVAAKGFDRASIERASSRDFDYNGYIEWAKTAKMRFLTEIESLL